MSAVEAPPQLPKAQQAVHTAQELGAGRDPTAAPYLRLANQQMTVANQLLADGRVDDAAIVLDRARADAELASALSREATARGEAEQAVQRVQEIAPTEKVK
jgi:hypothetical protein